MKALLIIILGATTSGLARADFSYTTATKSGSAATPVPVNQASKTYLKGQKMKIETGNSATILDFDTQSITYIDNNRKVYNVSKFTDLGQSLKQSGVEMTVDAKETGERKTINGYNASEMVLTADVEIAATGRKNRMEMDFWISSDVPGSQEMVAFYKRNVDRFPWAAMAGQRGRGDQSMESAMSAFYRKMAAMKGVVVMQVMKMGGGGNDAQAAQAQQAMAQASKQLEELRKQGKLPPQVEQQLAKMKGGTGGGSMFEVTLESTGFSSAPIPDSVFAIPAGYQKSEQRY